MSEPFAHTSGPHNACVVIVGEAHGESEERYGAPFCGQSGRELFRMLGEAWGSQPAIDAANTREDGAWLSSRDAWLAEHSVLLTNVFALRPAGNNLGALCGARGEMPAGYTLAQVRNENPRYVRPEFLPHVLRLYNEIETTAPNLVIPLGATATWAFSFQANIGSVRGAVASAKIDELRGRVKSAL